MQIYLTRWRNDVYEMFSGINKEPFGGRRWEKDFVGEITPDDTKYAIFLGVLTMVPASVIALVSAGSVVDTMARFFSTPIQCVINGFLTSVLLFISSYVPKISGSNVSGTFETAFKLMLRIMAVYPILRFLCFNNIGLAFSTLVYGGFVIRGALKTYSMPRKNAFIFFGTTYFVFFLLQLQAGAR